MDYKGLSLDEKLPSAVSINGLFGTTKASSSRTLMNLAITIGRPIQIAAIERSSFWQKCSAWRSGDRDGAD
jgi:hypothetical protein